MKKRIFIAIILSLIVGQTVDNAVSGPNCPTEDSCTAQYYDHAWHITEVTP